MRFYAVRHYCLMGVCLAAISAASPVLADEAAHADDATAADASMDGDAIVVYGRGETHQEQSITSKDIADLAPGTSPLKAIEKLPSVNFQSADAFGNYEWSTRVTIRSFNQNQLGFTFDGIPLGDMSYGNYNGLHVSRAVSPENVGSVRVAQGAGALGTQSTSNLGGTVQTFSADPEGRFGIDVAGTYGSDETKRGFVRLNMGTQDGVKGYVSYAYGSTDKYKGDGTQDQHLVNAKVVIPIGEAKVDGWFSYSDRREEDYQDMSLGMLSRLGYSSDNTHPNYALAIQLADIGNNRGDTGAPISNAAAGKVYPGKYTSVDDAYYDASGLRKDTLASLGMTTPLGDNVKFSLKGYYHHNKGRGLWATPYVPSPNGVPISLRTTEYDIDRGGVFGSLDFTLGIQSISVGGWYEHNDFNQARRFYALASRTDPGLSFRDYPKNPFATQWEFDFTTITKQYYVSDKIDLGALKAELGWKGFDVSNEAKAIVQSVFPQGKIRARDWFQPHVGVVYELSDQAEAFAGFTQSTRAFPAAVTSGPFSTTQAGFNAIKDKLKPETSDTYELGLRFNTSRFNGVLGAYLVNFKNRLLAVSVGSGIQGNPSALQNVGSVRSIGVEAAGDFKVTSDISLFASYTYTDSTYRDDVFNGNNQLIAPIKGKTVVDSPKHMARGEVNWQHDGAFARIGLNWMSKRYFTYTNDQSVPGRFLADVSIGYHFNEKTELQFTVNNVFDKQYIATIGSNGFTNSGDNQTLLVGAPRQAFMTLKTGF
ncbi:TonB-dependent receptor [Novosphingobium sp.]|uniref:TonB-dependent receptor n=1 Tax=Novosphingobium sp. TaxID=1874826 RepID=UPI003FA5C097